MSCQGVFISWANELTKLSSSHPLCWLFPDCFWGLQLGELSISQFGLLWASRWSWVLSGSEQLYTVNTGCVRWLDDLLAPFWGCLARRSPGWIDQKLTKSAASHSSSVQFPWLETIFKTAADLFLKALSRPPQAWLRTWMVVKNFTQLKSLKSVCLQTLETFFFDQILHQWYQIRSCQ